MTPEEIFEELEAQPPLRRAKFAEKYVGLEVDWAVVFSDAWEDKGKTVRVAFHFEPMSVRSVVGTVSLADYPQLEHLRAGEPLRVRGRIRAVSRLRIELDITEIVFCVEAVAV